MPQILPVRGLRYTAAAGPLSELLAPPYDVISAVQQRELATRNPHNAVLLELAEGGEERYDRVAGLLREWEASGMLQRDDAPQLYVYEQSFVEGGATYTRRALLAGVEAQPWEEGAVKPHEFTMSGPKEDRLKLLQATRTQFSPVFMIARDRAGQLRQFLGEVIRSRPCDSAALTPDGDGHRLWVVEAGRYEMRFLAPLLPESFYIADGHHRYETAVTYRQWLAGTGETLPRDHPARFALTAIVAADDPGLVIRPIHRVVPRQAPPDWRSRLETVFEVEDIPGEATVARAAEFDHALAAEPGAIVALGLEPGKAHRLRVRDSAALMSRIPAGRSQRWAAIAPNELRYGALEPLWGLTDDDLRLGAVEYTHLTSEVLERVEGGACGFLLNPVGIGEVMGLADQGERMPQKSTFFHPKLGTGLVFHPLYE
ncbi:MAG: DUF1015 domain-containing protein [Chloroflexi bacterium]|nr:DUF1015 domain-containing protein [Chloroflexota bacterium]